MSNIQRKAKELVSQFVKIEPGSSCLVTVLNLNARETSTGEQYLVLHLRVEDAEGRSTKLLASAFGPDAADILAQIISQGEKIRVKLGRRGGFWNAQLPDPEGDPTGS